MVRVKKSTITTIIVLVFVVSFMIVFTNNRLNNKAPIHEVELTVKADSINYNQYKDSIETLNRVILEKDSIILNYKLKFSKGKKQWLELKKELALKDSIINDLIQIND